MCGGVFEGAVGGGDREREGVGEEGEMIEMGWDGSLGTTMGKGVEAMG